MDWEACCGRRRGFNPPIRSRRRSLVGDDPAIIGQRTRRHQHHLAAHLGQRLEARRDRVRERFGRRGGFGHVDHCVLFAVAPHNKPQRGELAMTLADLDIWPGSTKRPLTLGRLVRPTHPAREALGRSPGREVASGEAQERIVALKPRHDDWRRARRRGARTRQSAPLRGLRAAARMPASWRSRTSADPGSARDRPESAIPQDRCRRADEQAPGRVRAIRRAGCGRRRSGRRRSWVLHRRGDYASQRLRRL
jgi:hypothetical protein